MARAAAGGCDEGLLHFACYVAVCYTVYGASYDFLTTEHILGLVSQLRPDMVKQLKTAGSGKLPKAIQRRKTEHFTASANDVFATIRITAKDSTEECYAEILDYLCAVLEQEEFPRSYSVEFRGKEKLYLPIPGLPKKGVNQLFACAVQYPSLHPIMERYARLAMREFEWYQNLADEACAMPGTFAVFALGLEGEPWVRWCVTIWIYVMMNIPLCRRSLSTPFSRNTDLRPRPCLSWFVASSLCRV